MAMQWWAKAAERGFAFTQCFIGEIYMMGFIEELVPVGTFVRDAPLGMKYLGVLTAADRSVMKKIQMNLQPYPTLHPCCAHSMKTSRAWVAEAQRKLCGRCVDAGQAKVRYCGRACQLIHWRHQTASHKAECASRAATRDACCN